MTIGMKYSQLGLGHAKPELGISQNENLKYKLLSYVSILLEVFWLCMTNNINVMQVYKLPLGF